MKSLNTRAQVLAGIVVVILVFALSFAVFSGLVWVVCWAFGLEFVWKYVLGAYAVLLIVRSFTRK